MVTINASPERSLQLGYAGEDKVTKVIFPYNESWLEYGDGEFFIRVLRPGDTEPYNAQDVTNDSEAMTLTLVVTDVELSRQGYGQMQVVYIGPQVVKKSRIYTYRVSKAIDEPIDPPDGSIVNQIVQSLGDLSDLTTTAKTDLVSAINEVNEHGGGGGGSVTVDSEFSTTSENPVQNKVVTSAIRGKADTQTVSALADAVQDLDGDVQGLQTTVQSKADTSTVTALSGTVSGLQTTVQSKADATTVTTLSGTVTGLQTSKADKSYVDTQLAGKASTQTVSDLSDDVSDLQTGLAGKVGDVQINGASIVSNGVANVPIANSSNLGVSKCSASFGINARADGYLNIVSANSTAIKNGNASYLPVTTTCQHESVFYGLAKAAGHDEKSSTLPVGTYTQEAKTAIRTMLGLQDVYEDYSSALTALGVIE